MLTIADDQLRDFAETLARGLAGGWRRLAGSGARSFGSPATAEAVAIGLIGDARPPASAAAGMVPPLPDPAGREA
jgi:hypothetical protein